MTGRLQRALEDLYGLERRKDKLGLEGTRALLAALGNPERSFRSVHVAGTNGKGTVCALVERVLREAGHRTGLFTSPHLVDFRERIRVDGRWADEAWLERALERIQSLPEGKDRTFFEVATALGFLYFAEQRVEWAVVEVGLGGRLDTTNVLTSDVCAITSIGLDHTEILGDTIAQIAAEKAGIVKPGVPVVVGLGARGEALDVIERIAREAAADLIDAVSVAPVAETGERVQATTEEWGTLEIGTRQLSAFEPENLATALATLETLNTRGVGISREAVLEGIRQTRWPGRFERCPMIERLWWDGAHNTEGAAALTRRWRVAGLPLTAAIVLAVSRDKDVAAMLEPLASIARGPRLIATRSHNERAMQPEAIADLARAAGWHASVAPDVPTACGAALAEPASDQDPVLLTGSLFAVGEAMEAFGGAPGEQL